MPTILSQTQWNTKFYCMVQLDNGQTIELKSETGKNFDELVDKYSGLAMEPIVDTRQQELDSYAKQKWPTLAKEAAAKTPITDEKSIAEWVDKVSMTTAGVVRG